MATDNSSKPDAPIGDGEPLQQLPGAVRFWFSAVAIIILVICVLLMGAYIRDPKQFAAPSELQLGTLLLASFLTLFVMLVPWHKLGLRIRKVGAVEFERVVSTQAAEYAEDFAEMRLRIDELERKLRGVDDVASVSESFATPVLRPLLTKFLTDHQPTAYSALRVREWGGRQSEFEKFMEYDLGMIRHVLQSMVAEGVVATRVSRLGNTLYKVAD